MRLLVTRPQPDANETAARLSRRGHTVLVQPMMEIAFSPEPAGLLPPAAIVATSRNCLRALERWPLADAWRRLPLYVVGGATAALARDIGFGDVRVGGGDAAALATLIRDDFDRNAGPILYPAAHERAADLAGMLAGFTVMTVDAYRAVAASGLDDAVAAAIRTAALDGALFFSRRTAAVFADLVDAAGVGAGLRRTVFFALSQTVAEPLLRLRPASIMVAPQPTEDSLLSLIAPAG